MILFATQNFLPDVGGTQLYVTGLADALAARGHRIEVYCDASSRDASNAVDTARSYPIRRFGGLRPWLRWTKGRAVNERLRRGDIRALVTDTWKSLEHLAPDALRAVRVMPLAHGSEFLVAPGSGKGRRLIASLAKANVVAANSQFTADLLKPFVCGRTEVKVLLPGVAPPAAAPRRLDMAVKKGPPRLLTIARLEPRKGVDMVLRALPALKAAYPGIAYDVIGKGSDKPRLVELARTLDVADSVMFHGYVPETEKARLISGADLFVLANRREPGSVEGFGIVYLEAAAYGIPALAGADGGTRDAVLDGRTGIVTDAGEPRNVENVLVKLLQDRSALADMGRVAHARFWSEFAWEAAIRRFENVLLGNGP